MTPAPSENPQHTSAQPSPPSERPPTFSQGYPLRAQANRAGLEVAGTVLFSSILAPSQRRVLVIHHDAEICDLLSEPLLRSGLRVATATDVSLALAQIERGPPDVVLLDMFLPDISGPDLLRSLRALTDAPLIAMSSETSVEDRVLALELGADDYIHLPFPARELVARVRALLRRAATTSVASKVLTFGDLRIDVSARQVALGGSHIELTSKEFDLLAFLAASPRRVFTRAELLQRVWGSRAEWQDPATVTEHVRRLRRKLGLESSQPRWIVTVRSVGYRFEA